MFSGTIAAGTVVLGRIGSSLLALTGRAASQVAIRHTHIVVAMFVGCACRTGSLCKDQRTTIVNASGRGSKFKTSIARMRTAFAFTQRGPTSTGDTIGRSSICTSRPRTTIHVKFRPITGDLVFAIVTTLRHGSIPRRPTPAAGFVFVFSRLATVNSHL